MKKRTQNILLGSAGVIVALHLLEQRQELQSDTRTWYMKLGDWMTGEADDSTTQKAIRSAWELPTEIINGLIQGIGYKTVIFSGTAFWMIALLTRTKNTSYKKNRATWTKARGGGWSRDTY